MAPTPGEETDLVQWGFSTLIDSYDSYHAGERDGRTSRPLREFAAKMPKTVEEPAVHKTRPAASSSLFVGGLGGGGSGAAPQNRKEPRREAASASSEPKAPARGARGSGKGARGSRGDHVEKAAELPRAAAKAPALQATAERGPIPPPFQGPGLAAARPNTPARDSLQQGPGSHSDAAAGLPTQPGADAEELPSAEDIATWLQYYRQCTEYLENVAAQVGGAATPAPTTVASRTLASERAPMPAMQATLGAPSAHAGLGAAAPSVPHAGVGSTAAAAFGAAGLAPSNLHSLAASALTPSALGASPQSFSAAASYGGLPGSAAQGHGPLSPGPWPGTNPLAPGLPSPAMGRSAYGGLSGSVPVPSSGAAGIGIDDEALANLLMAWYYSGYYTGHFAARQGR